MNKKEKTWFLISLSLKIALAAFNLLYVFINVFVTNEILDAIVSWMFFCLFTYFVIDQWKYVCIFQDYK